MRKKRKKDKELQLAKFTQYLASGFSRVEIMEMMGLEEIEFDSLYGKFYEGIEREVQDKTTLRLYAEYCAKKGKLIRDLESLKVALQSANWKNGQAYVAAVRTQSEILDMMIKTGQELNIVEQRPQELLLIDGQDARELDSDDLEDAVLEELQEAQKAASGFSKKGKGKVIALYPQKD